MAASTSCMVLCQVKLCGFLWACDTGYQAVIFNTSNWNNTSIAKINYMGLQKGIMTWALLGQGKLHFFQAWIVSTVGPFSTRIFVALQCVWVANPRLLSHLQFWNRVWRGSCPAWFMAQEIKQEGIINSWQTPAELTARPWHILHYVYGTLYFPPCHCTKQILCPI